MKASNRTHWACAGLCVAVAACAGDSTAPPKPASVASAAGAVSGTVGLALAPSPQFIVRDASGNAIAGVPVTIVVTGGGGTLTGAPATSGNGATSVGTWTLGTTSGTNALTVTVGGLAPLVLTATGTPGPATQIVVASGGAQAAPAAGSLPAPVVFKVADVFGNGVAGISVSFGVTSGGGSLTAGGAVVTDANGLAPAPAWSLGKSTTAQQLRATAGTLMATATASVASNFTLEVRFFGPAIDPAIQDAFTAAALRIQGSVTGDLADVPLTAFSVSGCGITGVSPLNETVDDVIVYANVAPNDGVGGILGSAGPCFTRVTGGLALIGVMNFDVADLQNLQTSGRLNDTILHEMMHALGFGTLWASKGQVSGGGTPSSSFIGVQAVAGCQFHGGGSNCSATIPLETTGGAGTRDVHWRENTSATGIGFNTELMTGFIEAAGIAMPLSRMSIASLADLGYGVNLLPYDAYTVPSSLAHAFGAIREAQGLGVATLTDIAIEPIGAVDATGRPTLFPRKR